MLNKLDGERYSAHRPFYASKEVTIRKSGLGYKICLDNRVNGLAAPCGIYDVVDFCIKSTGREVIYRNPDTNLSGSPFVLVGR
jgi:hypothetical protein